MTTRQRKARERAERLQKLIDEGQPKKRAAYMLGISERTATRYLGMAA